MRIHDGDRACYSHRRFAAESGSKRWQERQASGPAEAIIEQEVKRFVKKTTGIGAPWSDHRPPDQEFETSRKASSASDERLNAR